MGVNSTKILTKVLDNEIITISNNMGLRSVSIVLFSGVGNYLGNLSIDGVSNTPIPLSLGQSVTITVEGNQILDGIEINALGGVIYLMAKH